MGAYHPLYRGVEPTLLGLIDDVFYHGNLRAWATFTHTAKRLLERTGLDELDERVARNVFALHGGGARG